MSASTLLSLAEVLTAATRDKHGSVKYPLDCGCKGKAHWDKCDAHKAEEETDSARMMGIADLRFTHRDFTNLTQLTETLLKIRMQLITNPTKSCLIKIIPWSNHEADAG